MTNNGRHSMLNVTITVTTADISLDVLSWKKRAAFLDSTSVFKSPLKTRTRLFPQ